LVLYTQPIVGDEAERENELSALQLLKKVCEIKWLVALQVSTCNFLLVWKQGDAQKSTGGFDADWVEKFDAISR
jgi:hypothetical protein